VQVQGNVYLLNGAGGNTTVQIGNDGVLVVDTQFAPMADKIVAAIRTLTDKPIRYVVNTHSHPDHVGGNQAIASQGASLGGANVVGLLGNQAIRGAKIIATNVLNYMAPRTARRRRCLRRLADGHVLQPSTTCTSTTRTRLFRTERAHRRRQLRSSAGRMSLPPASSHHQLPYIDHSQGGNIRHHRRTQLDPRPT
jgi:mRNA degradation ribonuclease J1/J2